MTMKAALEILGIPTWHFVEMSANPPDIDMWAEALLAKLAPDEAAKRGIKRYGREEYDHLLARFGATTDQPAAILCEDLMGAYPDAKVVLVERDVEKWYKSFNDTVVKGTFHPLIPLARKIDTIFMSRVCDLQDILFRYYFDVPEPIDTPWLTNDLECRRMVRENARAMYRRHNAMIKRVVPKEKLLIFRWEDGWEPLCKHLGKPVPGIPFPHVNETQAVTEMIQVYIANSYKRALWGFAKKAVPVLGAAVAAGVWWMYSRRA